MRAPPTLILILLLALAPLAAAQDPTPTPTPTPDEAGDAPDAPDDAANEDGKDEEETEADDEPTPADGKDDKDARDEDKDDDVDRASRKVEVETSDDQVQIKLERESGDLEDEVKMVFSADEGWMKVEYKTANSTREAETELKVRFREAIEFADRDGDGAYTPGNDTLVATYAHEDLDWRILAPEHVTNAAGVAGTRIVGTGAFPGGGNLSFVLYVYGQFTDVNGTSLRPTDIKIDILVDDFPYTQDDTQVALLFQTEQEAKLESQDDDREAEGVAATANGFVAYFTWAEEALVDGATTPVRTTLVDAEDKNESSDDESKETTERTFWFAYARGDAINHDPVLGIAADEPDATPSGSTTPPPTTRTHDDTTHATPPAGLALALAAIAAVAIALRRRRG